MKIQWSEKIDTTVVEFVKNLSVFITGRTITFQKYINLECKEIFGDENKWYAGENLRRPPSHLDCQRNYINHKADKLFHKRYHYLVERPWQKKIRATLAYVRHDLLSLLRHASHKKWVSN